MAKLHSAGFVAKGELPAATYSRFSSDQQDETSIAQQQRACHEAAKRNGHQIGEHFDFRDDAVSGTKRDRGGLKALLDAAAAGLIAVLYVFSLSRLARESVISLPLLKQLVYNDRVRVISVTEGIDSDREGWDLIAHFASIQHERFIAELSKQVLRGQCDNIARMLSVGDHCFGFKSVPAPDFVVPAVPRRGLKIPKVYAIDTVEAQWVDHIFKWFVVERRSIRWIVAELNRLHAPKDHRSTTPTWKHGYVVRLLANRKYIGIWPWGERKNRRDPLTGRVTQEPRSTEEASQWTRSFPHLALVSEEVFRQAQLLLKENEDKHAAPRGEKGKFRGSRRGPDARSPKHLLSGLLECGHCGRRLYAGGTGGKYYFCPGYREGNCSCQTTVPRERAARLLLNVVRDKMLANSQWLDSVWQHTLVAWRRLQQTLPGEIAAVEQSLTDVDRKIKHLLDLAENGGADSGIMERLAARRKQQTDLRRTIEQLHAKQPRLTDEPTREWMVTQVEQLATTLNKTDPSAAFALRNLSGGRIIVEQVQRHGKKRHYLIAKVALRISSVIAAVDPALQDACADQQSTDVVVELCDTIVDSRVEEAKQLFDEGLLAKEIAQRMGCGKSTVTKLLQQWSVQHGQPLEDGRRRRWKVKSAPVPFFQQIAGRVMELHHTNVLLGEIAEELDCDRNTVTKAIQWWHAQRGLDVPDGRTRRKDLARKSKGSPKGFGNEAISAPAA